MDLRSRVVSLEHQATAHSQRLTELEKGQRTGEIVDAKRDEQFKSLIEKVASVDKKIDSVGDSMKWVVKLIIGGLISAVVIFIVNGSLKIP
jgi:chorismate synthase